MASNELDISTQTITPQMAREWLVNNTHNRNISKRLINLFSRDMAAGKWQLNGDAIRFNCDGLLIDGQHRLLAIVEANTKIKSLVITGLAKECQETVDMGRKRSSADVLSLRGYTTAAMLAAAAARLLDMKRRSREQRKGTTAEIIAIVEGHPKLADAIAKVHASYPVFASVLGAVYYVTSTVIRGHKDEAESFINVIQNGQPAYKNDPAHKFREKLIRTRAAKQHLRNWEMLCSTMRVWNAFVDKEPLEKIYFTDEMPDIPGFNPDRL